MYHFNIQIFSRGAHIYANDSPFLYLTKQQVENSTKIRPRSNPAEYLISLKNSSALFIDRVIWQRWIRFDFHPVPVQSFQLSLTIDSGPNLSPKHLPTTTSRLINVPKVKRTFDANQTKTHTPLLITKRRHCQTWFNSKFSPLFFYVDKKLTSFWRYRHVLVGNSRGFGFRCGNVGQVLDHFLGIFRLTGAGFSCAQDGLVFTIC